MDRVRDPVREELRDLLSEIGGEAVVRLITPGLARGRRFHWPATLPERVKAFAALERALYGADDLRGEIRIHRHGEPRTCYWTVLWPAAADFWAESDPPPPADPPCEVEVSQAANAILAEEETALVPVRVQPLSALERPPKASPPCAFDVCSLLYQSQRRLTVLQMEEAFNSGPCWKRSTIEATVSWLQKLDLMDNGRDGFGKGYGLVRWTHEPESEEFFFDD